MESKCKCGQPQTAGVIHRRDGPCYMRFQPPAEDADVAQPPVECAHYVYWQAATETYICNRCGVTLVFRPASQWAAVTGLVVNWEFRARRATALSTEVDTGPEDQLRRRTRGVWLGVCAYELREALELEQQCDDCGKIAELRPYGPGGSCICFQCMLKDEEGAKQRMEEVLCRGDPISDIIEIGPTHVDH